MADPCAMDAAVLALLRADATLAGLCPGGVHFALAEPGVDTFVLVDRIDHTNDARLFHTAAGEAFIYLVKAVVPGTASSLARSAAARVRVLLEGCLTLQADGYALQAPVEEVEAVRIVEVDESNTDRRVQHMGGQYVIQVQRLD